MKLRLNPEHAGLRMVLGPLELQIMSAVWDQHGRPASNKQIRHHLQCQNVLYAVPTISTTTRRLTEKGYLRETMVRGVYMYVPALYEDELEEFVVRNVLTRLREAWPDIVTDCMSEELVHAE